MKVGLVKEVKNHEYRVAMRPADVKTFCQAGHQVLVTKDAGVSAGFENQEYEQAGAQIADDNAKVYAESEMIIKVKEPISEEYQYLRENLLLYCYLHLAAEKELTDELLKRNVAAVAYETITGENNTLPCLAPMSAIAGRLSIQNGSKELESTRKGSGILLGGVPGTARGNVTIIGGGVVGLNACKIAIGMGARVRVLDIKSSVLNYLDDLYGNQIDTLYSEPNSVEKCLESTDLLIGALLVPGAKAPKIITQDHLKLMKAGSVIVDVAIDQGGCSETSRPTSHEEPTYIVDNIIHYCVTNMPGCVPRTSSMALANNTMPHALAIASKGIERAAQDNIHIYNGINTYKGSLNNEPVAESLDLAYTKVNF